ncbi:hypothetical protein PEC302107_34950 [Pectobacterium araliae]|nr:hypothetical protein PEC302107_34950 [Pectobacterium carotovorum subsp. carotovorum]
MILLTNSISFVWVTRHRASTHLHHPKAKPAILGCNATR